MIHLALQILTQGTKRDIRPKKGYLSFWSKVLIKLKIRHNNNNILHRMFQLLKFKISTTSGLKNIPTLKKRRKDKTQTLSILSKNRRHNMPAKSKRMPRTSSLLIGSDRPRRRTRVIQRIMSAILGLPLIIRN